MSDNVLTPKQSRAIAAILSTRSLRDAAKSAQVSERTLGRWLSSPGFVAALKDAEAQAFGDVVRRLTSLCAKAMDVLDDILGSASASDNARLRASGIVLGSLLTFKERQEFGERIAALEKKRE